MTSVRRPRCLPFIFPLHSQSDRLDSGFAFCFPNACLARFENLSLAESLILTASGRDTPPLRFGASDPLPSRAVGVGHAGILPCASKTDFPLSIASASASSPRSTFFLSSRTFPSFGRSGLVFGVGHNPYSLSAVGSPDIGSG